MNELFLSDKRTAWSANFLIGIIAFSVVLPIKVNSILTVGSFSLLFFYSILNKTVNWKLLYNDFFIVICIHFVIQALGLLHSPDRAQGYMNIERFAFSLVFPVLFLLARKDQVNLFNLIIIFMIGCVGLTLYGIGYSLFLLDDSMRAEAFEFGHYIFTDNIFIHPSYLSIYFIFIFFFLLEVFRLHHGSITNLKKLLLGLLLSYIILMLFFLRSQSGLVIFVLLVVIYAIILLKRRAWLVTFLLVTTVLIVSLLDKDRSKTFFDTYGKNVSSALDNRFKVWNGALEAIKARPVFGIGTGGEQTALNEGYKQTKFQEGIDNLYNAHNQYLEFWVHNGIFEIACFIVLLVYSFRRSLKNSNYTFLMFNMLFCLSMLTESCLNVQRGVVFFYFFLSAFILVPDSGLPGWVKKN